MSHVKCTFLPMNTTYSYSAYHHTQRTSYNPWMLVSLEAFKPADWPTARRFSLTLARKCRVRTLLRNTLKFKNDASSPRLVQKAFWKCGIHPLDMNVFTDVNFAASENTSTIGHARLSYPVYNSWFIENGLDTQHEIGSSEQGARGEFEGAEAVHFIGRPLRLGVNKLLPPPHGVTLKRMNGDLNLQAFREILLLAGVRRNQILHTWRIYPQYWNPWKNCRLVQSGIS